MQYNYTILSWMNINDNIDTLSMIDNQTVTFGTSFVRNIFIIKSIYS